MFSKNRKSVYRKWNRFFFKRNFQRVFIKADFNFFKSRKKVLFIRTSLGSGFLEMPKEIKYFSQYGWGRSSSTPGLLASSLPTLSSPGFSLTLLKNSVIFFSWNLSFINKKKQVSRENHPSFATPKTPGKKLTRGLVKPGSKPPFYPRVLKTIFRLFLTKLFTLSQGIHMGLYRKLKIKGFGLKAHRSRTKCNLRLGTSFIIKKTIPRGILVRISRKHTLLKFFGNNFFNFHSFLRQLLSLRRPFRYKDRGLRMYDTKPKLLKKRVSGH